jgi:mannose-6-phosphate isomerase-like protein (cupin superfamily)
MPQHIPLNIPAGGGECLWVVGDCTTILLSGAQTGGSFTLCEIEVSPGKGAPYHHHANEDETFIVKEGVVDFIVDGERIQVAAGGVVHAPQGVPHLFTNSTSEMARFYVISAPAGMDDFFRSIGEPISERNAPAPEIDFAKLTAGCEAHGITILPPPA